MCRSITPVQCLRLCADKRRAEAAGCDRVDGFGRQGAASTVDDQPDDAGARPRTFEFTITPFGTAEGVAIEGELAFGLWEIQAGRRLTREIRNVPAFRQAVGDDLLVGLVRLFAAVDRAAEPAPIAWTDLLRCSPLCSMH